MERPDSIASWRLSTVLLLAACATTPKLRGEEMMVRGEPRKVGTRVVLWTDPMGYRAGEGHYGTRPEGDLEDVVHQIILHYDAAGTSAQAFKVLEKRQLSAHFLIDRDGTIYQTLDLKERAWHAGEANDHSIGIEIANVGAYEQLEDLDKFEPLPDWIARGHLKTVEPHGPIVRAAIHGTELWQFPYTDAQYDALVKLCRALRKAFPRIRARRPTATTVIQNPIYFNGILGHYHLSASKVDPGPAFDWERLMTELR